MKHRHIFLTLLVALVIMPGFAGTRVQPVSAGFANTYIQFQFSNWGSDVADLSITLVDVPAGGGKAIHYLTLSIPYQTSVYRITEDLKFSTTISALIVPWLEDVDYIILGTNQMQDNMAKVEVQIMLFHGGTSLLQGKYLFGNHYSNGDVYRVFEINLHTYGPRLTSVAQWEYGDFLYNTPPSVQLGRDPSKWYNFHNLYRPFIISTSDHPYTTIERLIAVHSFETPKLSSSITWT